MKKGFWFVFKATILIILVLFLVIITFTIKELLEKPPEHPLDFQDVNNILIEEPINSFEDGLPYALKQAYEWRLDAVLTGVEIISNGKEEIKNHNGMIEYIFEFNNIDKSKPSGIMFIFINTSSNKIELVEASHDEEVFMRDFTEIELSNLPDGIKKVYNVAIETIGKETIFQYDHPFVRLHINSEFAIFELSPSKLEGNEIKSRVKIDVKTYDILNKEIH